MRPVTRVALGAMLLGMGAVGYFKSDLKKTFVDHGSLQAKEGSASSERSPASLEDGEVLTENYEFKRHVKAVLHTEKNDQDFANLSYQGIFSIQWKTPQKAMIAFELENGTRSQVSFELTLNQGILQGMKAGAVASDADQDALNILKDFSTILAYRSDEDTAGKYTATFQEEKISEEEVRILKQKKEYSTRDTASIRILSSVHEIHVQPQTQKMISAQGHENTAVQMGASEKDSAQLLTVSEYSLIRKGTSKRSMVLTKTEDLHTVDLSLQSNATAQTIPWLNLMESLNGIQSLAQPDRLALFHELVKSLKSDPKNLKNFLDWAAAHGNEPGIRTFAIGVLATMGGDEAQSTLVQWFQQFPESRPVILNAFTTTAAPFTPGTRNFLSNLMDQAQRDPNSACGAAFAMGSGIRNHAENGNSSEAKNDIDRLQSLMNSAKTPEAQGIALSAMGNAGNPAFIPTIEKSLNANDESVREKAVLALRLMPAAQTVSLVTQAWSDPSIKVKSAAIQVIHFQGEPSVYQGVLNQCVQDSSGSSGVLRDACRRVIAEHQHG